MPSNVMELVVASNQNSFWPNPAVRPPRKGTWKRDPKKTKIVQSAWCEVCKVDCNSKDVLDQHKLGKKHNKNLEKLKESKKGAHAVNTPAAAATTTVPTAANSVIGPKENPAAGKGKVANAQLPKKKKAASQSESVEDLETKRRKVMESGAAADAVRVCTLCNVVCNSQTVFNYHIAGQKHVAMVKKQATDGTVTAGPRVVTAA